MKASIVTSLAVLGAASASAIPSDNSYGGGSYGGNHHHHKRACSPAEIALATGIHLNIQGQYAEYNATLQVANFETSHPSGATPSIYEAIGALQANIQAGMNIRAFNQQIAPAGNAALPGLAKYAAAQEQEKALAAVLVGDQASDSLKVTQLQSDIRNGIQLNVQNLNNATSDCELDLTFPNPNQMGV